jgi:hypothetical protein
VRSLAAGSPWRWKLLVGLGFACVVGFYSWTAATSGFPFRPAKRVWGYYNLQARAFQAGQLSLQIPPSAALLALADPYDPRQNEGLRLHDAALYKGRYYLYYGPAPALLLFAPFRMVTRLDLPEPLALAILCSVGLLFSFLLLRALCVAYLPDTPPWLLGACLPALAFGSITPFLLRRPQHYEVAIAAGYAFAFAGLYCFASAMTAPSVSKRRLALGSLLLGLAGGSRVPQLAALVVPCALTLYLAFRLEHAPLRHRLLTGAALWAPVGACVFLLGLYNNLRFDAWTDFGLRYTLQGLISAREYKFFDAERLPASLYYYLFVPPRFIRVFPFVVLQPDWYVRPPAGYVLERVAGILPMVPLLWILVISPAFPSALWRRRRTLFGAAGLLLAVGCALILLFSFSAGTMRYEVDFATYLLVPALLFWCAGLNALRGKPWAYRGAVTLFVLLLVATVSLNAAISVTGYYNNLETASPESYRALQRFFHPLEILLQPGS